MVGGGGLPPGLPFPVGLPDSGVEADHDLTVDPGGHVDLLLARDRKGISGFGNQDVVPGTKSYSKSPVISGAESRHQASRCVSDLHPCIVGLIWARIIFRLNWAKRAAQGDALYPLRRAGPEQVARLACNECE